MKWTFAKGSLAGPQKIKHRITIWSNNSTHRYILKRIENICLHKNLYIATLFIIAKRWKQPRCPSTDEWINCGRFRKWNIIWLFKKCSSDSCYKWIKLANIMWRERSQYFHFTYFINMIMFIWNVQNIDNSPTECVLMIV